MRALELHVSAKIIQRSKGRSSVAAAAYRAGVRLHDERTGLTHDYTNKSGVEFSRIYLPENAPEQFRDRETLWNSVEKKENRSNSCTARELEVAFPYEFNIMQRRETGDGIVRELMRRYGCAVDICFHEPNISGDERNYHAHILFTDRGFDTSTKDGWAKNKYRDLSNDKITLNGEKTTRGKQEILSLREYTAGVMNHIAKRDDLSVMVEHLSFEARGIDREPQIHLGSVANDMERKGNTTERGSQNNKIIDLNKKREEAHKQVNYEKFDEFAGAKRAAFQSWSLDDKINEDRRCESERRKLERELEEFHGEKDRAIKTNISAIQNKLQDKGLKGIARDLLGHNKRYIEEVSDLNKSLASGEMRKQEARETLANLQNERLLKMAKQHEKAEKIIEEKIDKARSSFKEDDTDGKGDQQGGLTARKVKRNRSKKTYETARKVDRTRKTRTTSYSGKDTEGKQKKRLKNSHNEALDKQEKSVKKRGGAKPEHDFTPPRGPSLGR
ncbi:MAG: hypothetical protein COA74_11665 [Gammaproteobacteria bacterium]|nr:MAG: hypothetical protein COA74_11665 [Gammaproteobacteria bacterium]